MTRSTRAVASLRSIERAVGLLVRGHAGRRRELVGAPLLMSDGRSYTPFRHTAVDPPFRDDGEPVVVQPRFRLRGVPPGAHVRHWIFQRVCIVTTPFFVGARGFGSKLWMYDPVSGSYAGLYDWNDERAAQAYADGLCRILRWLSVTGSVGYELVRGSTVDEYLRANQEEAMESIPSASTAPATTGRAMVVYESMFGNTEDIARAVAAGLGEVVHVDVVEVTSAPTAVGGVDLLVVGAPTHAFGLSRPNTRADAGTKGARPDASAGCGLREWLVDATVSPRVPVATFDTRVRHFPGSAAKAARKRARALGLDVSPGVRSFWVDGVRGPLLDGERDRAAAWGRELGARLAGRRAEATARSA